ncbi:MAG: hypothetical protein ABIL06_23325 [Pseudomonadota bacterium]
MDKIDKDIPESLTNWMLGTGCWMLDAGYWILDAGYWMTDERLFQTAKVLAIVNRQSSIPTGCLKEGLRWKQGC